MDNITKYRKTIIITLLIILISILFFESITLGKGAEKTAQKFVKHMLEGDAKACAQLMHDDLIYALDFETKKLFINSFDKKLSSLIEEYKDIYGKSWSYDVIVIDSFNVDIIYDTFYYTAEYAEEGNAVKVVLEIKHKGRVFFNDKEGTDEIALIMARYKRKWLVYDFIF